MIFSGVVIDRICILIIYILIMVNFFCYSFVVVWCRADVEESTCNGMF